MPLSDVTIRNIKATDKPQKKFDGDGLYILVSPTKKPNRGKAWRFKYFFDGKEKLLSLIPAGRSAIVETWPALWNKKFPRGGRTAEE